MQVTEIKLMEVNDSNSEYARFLEAWFLVFKEIEPAIILNFLKFIHTGSECLSTYGL